MTYRIAVGVDASAPSISALTWALGQAESKSGEVVAVFCWQLPLLGMPGGFDHDELESRAKTLLLETVRNAAPEPRVPIITVVAEGDPIESLLEAAKDADLLVLGIRGRAPFTGLLLGSVSQACAAAASCPVVLVKKPQQPHPGLDSLPEPRDTR